MLFKQLHIKIERQVKTLIDFEEKTKTKTGISKSKSTNKTQENAKAQAKISPKSKASPRQGKAHPTARQAMRREEREEKRRRGKTINPILVSRYCKRYGTTMEKRNVLRKHTYPG